MVSRKEISLTVMKPYDYKPIPPEEKQRITKQISEHILEVANRFDGPSSITITIQARGNA